MSGSPFSVDWSKLSEPPRWLLAAAAVASTNAVLRIEEAISPGLPQAAVLATVNVPFFQHMIICFWIGILFFVGGGRVLPFAQRRAFGLHVLIIATTVAAAAAQWWFPNY